MVRQGVLRLCAFYSREHEGSQVGGTAHQWDKGSTRTGQRDNFVEPGTRRRAIRGKVKEAEQRAVLGG